MKEIKGLRRTDVYDWNLAAIHQGKRIVINQGGTSSSKTYSILQVLLTIVLLYRKPILISVVSETMPHLKRGVMRDFFNILSDYGLYSERQHNKTDHTYTFKDQYGEKVIEFFSADNPGKVRGARRDILFINECNNVAWEVYDQLEVRTKKVVFLDFNPVSEFWAHERLMNLPNAHFLKSTFLNNPYLDKDIVKSILSRRETDKNWWRVYGEGEIGRLEGVVFDNWHQVDFYPEGSDSVWYGLDFGFTNDPTALIKVCKQSGELWLQEIFYETGMLNKDISLRMEQHGLRKGIDEIIADSAEPKSIYELRQGGWQIRGVSKGTDSVRKGIDTLKGFKMNVTKDSLNLIKELRNYKWETDKMTGKPLNVPIDQYNHGIDCVRYVALMKLARRDFFIEYEN